MLDGSAAEFERDVPFSVWVDALDAYVASQRSPDAAACRDELARAAHVLPALGAATTRSPTSASARTARSRTLLELLSDDQALVLVLDDLHWSDGASVELIAALVRRWARALGAAGARASARRRRRSG